MKYMLSIFSLFVCLWAFLSCTKSKSNVEQSPPVSTEVTVQQPTSLNSLSWEKNHPERKAWSDFIFELIDGELFTSFDSAKDASRVCLKYSNLTKGQRIMVWSEFISGIAYYESDWSPTSRMTETTMGKDPVTGKQVASEGLLQLSYQDIPNYGALLKYPACKIDWQKDKSLAVTDSKKTIFDPIINLECGLRILSNQIQKRGSVILSSGVYWSTLKDGGEYSKVDSIIAMVGKTGLCN